MITLPEGTFFGVERARRQVGGLLMTETAYRPGDALPRHDHARAYFCLVLRGGFTERDGRRVRECGSATVIFHPPGAAHSDRFGPGASGCFNLELEDPWLERMREGVGGLPSDSVVFRQQRANWIARHLHDEFGSTDPAARLAIEGLALALLADVARPAGRAGDRTPRWVDRAAEIVRAAFPDIPGLSAIAAEIGVHPVHLARVFRSRHGCSIGEYARRLRVERAAEALRDPEVPIARVAHRLGYADQSHFARSFRRATGLSPSEYRRIQGFARTRVAYPDQDPDGPPR
ncbi:MAG TPA: AraC family transcriptional regulator [Gemmatimonadota bacterium]|nr:AraC family transcriptional regulator [Gemmatimonadota bacterium]